VTNLLDRLRAHPARPVLSDVDGEYTPAAILGAAAAVAARLAPGVRGGQVAVMAPPGVGYVAATLACWMRGAMTVPLSPEHPPAEVEYVLADSEASAVLCDERLRDRLPPSSTTVVDLAIDPHGTAGDWQGPGVASTDAALMLYTSGTTGRPKGVVHTHASVGASIRSQVAAWEWSDSDRILHFLPLHHTHGIVNKLYCPLWVGARCDMLPRFDATTVFDRLSAEPHTVFMAVPTVYAKLIQAWEAADDATQQRWSEACRTLRLMVSGSAALAVPILQRWREISGHVLLERYGMTEIGMALTNPLHGPRRPGFVGQPFPEVQVRLADESGAVVDVPDDADAQGELEVRGPTVFREYWHRPTETTASFTADGWFRTGDQAAREDGAYRIVGRLSTDIMKSGGYKVSALEIENVLLAHPAIAECCVVGVADDVWGEKISAAVVLRDDAEPLDLDSLRAWARSELAPYKLPTALRIVEALPRNAMGKIVKPEARKLFDS
jgi:malonyl-CoA/methylmalonyl-CoA synthetase